MEVVQKLNWLKSKGYLHFTGQIETSKRAKELVAKVTNPSYVATYAFYPLILTNISERKFKMVPSEESRTHCYKDENGVYVKTAKSRPLHYAANLDAMIFSYYAEHLQNKYEDHIKSFPGLPESVIAYRKIPSETEGKHKSTIHFAYEIFEEIKKRSHSDDECMVLTFDIKSFFSSIDHNILKNTWSELLGFARLPTDHYNVFKASTQFSYVYLDELRLYKSKQGRKVGFDEKYLAAIRNKNGINAFFESPKAFRDKIKDGTLKLSKYPFRNKSKEPIGIPQGLPISAVLANLYLLDFDKKVLETVVNDKGGYYRRYSDDIVVVCSGNHAKEIEGFINTTLEESKVQISINKTETFIFKKLVFGKKPARLTSVKVSNDGEKVGAPFNYLGFEFNGQKALIKSANVAKFYRRMISSVKRKAKRAKKLAERTPGKKPCIYRRQLYKLYTSRPLHDVKVRKRWKKIIKIETGEYRLVTGVKEKDLRSNYLTYVKRASEIMNEPAIENQIRKHKTIFNQAIFRHLTKL